MVRINSSDARGSRECLLDVSRARDSGVMRYASAVGVISFAVLKRPRRPSVHPREIPVLERLIRGVSLETIIAVS